MTQAMKLLERQRGAKFDQICELYREQLGYRELKELSDAERQQIVEEAEELTENWDDAALTNWDLEPKGKATKAFVRIP
jgi:hypothetical protein